MSVYLKAYEGMNMYIKNKIFLSAIVWVGVCVCSILFSSLINTQSANKVVKVLTKERHI